MVLVQHNKAKDCLPFIDEYQSSNQEKLLNQSNVLMFDENLKWHIS